MVITHGRLEVFKTLNWNSALEVSRVLKTAAVRVNNIRGHRKNRLTKLTVVPSVMADKVIQ